MQPNKQETMQHQNTNPSKQSPQPQPANQTKLTKQPKQTQPTNQAQAKLKHTKATKPNNKTKHQQ